MGAEEDVMDQHSGVFKDNCRRIKTSKFEERNLFVVLLPLLIGPVMSYPGKVFSVTVIISGNCRKQTSLNPVI